ncbi:solute carrier family 23 member 1 [Notolabrus celidotus]|uniref:solute carrier family 23 member 1 n=1 Tax=Notolabrus celidotus TaxID=1203425 RepID=UPI00148FEDF7|nr:solute carrier family 23 member 1 [Notolabrus celidotus]
MWITLKQKHGLRVKRETVMRMLRQLNPRGTLLRARRRFIRRTYHSMGPNYLWYVDGYDKLKPFGFAISGCIDGFSRRIMWLKCGPTNNNPEVIKNNFIDCIRSVGVVPMKLCTDCGTENGAMAAVKDSEEPQLTDDIGEPHTETLEETVDHSADLVYSLNDRPPWYLCILLGFQHYILAFGGIIAVPLILAEPLCIKDNNIAKSQLISTIFFVSGLCTLLQTTIGTRLPVLQGGTFSFITPTLAILALPKWQCPEQKTSVMLSMQLQNNSGPLHVENSDEVWMSRMCEIQGAILVASLLQIVLGFSGLVGFVLQYIGPLAIAPTINLIGLSLFIEAGKKSGGHWGIAALTVCLILLFSQYLSKVDVPMIAYKDKKWKVFQYPLFKLFSALFGMCGAWLVCFLLTIFDVLPSKSNEYGFSARTDISLDAVTNSPWFHVPYPGQWGMPTVSVSSVLGMMAGVLASTMESIGDYYACARLSGAPPPPTHAINRGIAVEGIGCILAALWGTGNGTTSYSQNIAALGITKVGSRLVLQTTGILMIVLGIFGKFGAVFITIPDPVIGGMFLVMFGMIAAVGISNLQYVDLNSSRNLLILGFSTFSGLVLPSWFHSNPGIIDTGIKELDQVIVVLFTTHMFIGGFFGFILDNTIPGTDKERGIKSWQVKVQAGNNTMCDPSCYDIPFCNSLLKRFRCFQYLPFLPSYKSNQQATSN